MSPLITAVGEETCNHAVRQADLVTGFLSAAHAAPLASVHHRLRLLAFPMRTAGVSR